MSDHDDADELTVTVVLDAEDHRSVTWAALDAHDPARGRITVHPTPATSGSRELAHAVLASLGRPVAHLADEKISGPVQAWHAVAAWVTGDQIGQMLVLRAHLLNTFAWQALLELRDRTGVHLVLVYHARTLSAVHADLLTDRVVSLATLQQALATAPRRPLVLLADPPAPLPPLPATNVLRFRADAWRSLDPLKYAIVDALYRTGIDAACRWLSHHIEYQAANPRSLTSPMRQLLPDGTSGPHADAATQFLTRVFGNRVSDIISGLLCVGRESERRTVTDWHDYQGLRWFLSDLVDGSPSPTHTVALVRGAEAGFLLHGMLLEVPAELEQTHGPGISYCFGAQDATRIRAGIGHPVHAAALVAALVTGLSGDKLGQVPISALAASGCIMFSDSGHAAHAIPATAAGIMRAARAFKLLRGQQPSDSLLSDGIGHHSNQLRASAARASLMLPPLTDGQPWHLRTTCCFIGEPLHGRHAAQRRWVAGVSPVD